MMRLSNIGLTNLTDFLQKFYDLKKKKLDLKKSKKKNYLIIQNRLEILNMNFLLVGEK
jgi:hypothetical protein